MAKISPEFRQRAIALYTSGKSIAETGAILGCSKDKVWRILKRAKVECRHARISDADLESAKAQIEAGATVQEAADILHVHPGTLSLHLRERINFSPKADWAKRKTQRSAQRLDQAKASIIAAYETGQSIKRVAASTGHSVWTVSQALRAEGIVRSPSDYPRGKVKRRTRYDKTLIINDYKNGKTYAEIAKRHGVSIRTVSNILRSNEVQRIRRNPTRKTNAKANQIAQLRREGKTFRQIEDILGIPKSTAWWIYKNIPATNPTPFSKLG